MQLREASILVVDDEPTLREIFGRWFDDIAGKVSFAENGEEALQVLGANKIDLIVTDVRMPVMDGIALLRAVNAQGMGMPSVIFISGFTDLEPREFYALGAAALLEKPIRRQDLIQAAQRALAERDELWQKPFDVDGFPTWPAALQVWRTPWRSIGSPSVEEVSLSRRNRFWRKAG